MHYEIRRGLKPGTSRLTKAQRTSGTFAEEPVVLGKVFRRGMKPRLLSEEQFQKNKAPLLRLMMSGSIEIFVVDETKEPARLDYKTARGHAPPAEPPAPAAPVQPAAARAAQPSAGDVPVPPAPAREAGDEEQEAGAPPSSADEGTGET